MKRRDFVSRIGLGAIVLPTLLRDATAEIQSADLRTTGLPIGSSPKTGELRLKFTVPSGAVEVKHSQHAAGIAADEIADNTRITFKQDGVVKINGLEIPGKTGEKYRLFVQRDKDGKAVSARLVRGLSEPEFIELQRTKKAAREGK